jgi:DNA-binding winged helix-turn-helix (wHTH) protein/tetratricopeptide (TPR) repeat protein
MLKEMSNLQFGEFTLNLRLRELRRQEKVLPVSGKAFDLLVYMASNPGRPLTKTELLDAVWPELAVEESNLSQNVFLLRKVLGSGADGPIKTLAGRGYQFAAEVMEVPAATPVAEPVKESEPDISGFAQNGTTQDLTIEATRTRMVVQHDFEERVQWTFSRSTKVGAAILLVAAAGAVGWFGWQHWLNKTGGDPVKVVLTSLSGTTGDAVLDRSLSDAMRIDLGQSPYVSIISASTVRETLTQMTHKPDEVMNSATAREVCERTNAQAVLSGEIARVGQHFLLTEEATNCVDGSVVAEAKSEAAQAEDLPRSIDKLAESIRQKLGESRRSIARFSQPLIAANTRSLEALKAESEASQLMSEGKDADAIVLLKKAIAADPNFANAYADLANCYISAGDTINARTTLEKAYSLRETATEPVKYSISSSYFTYETEDLFGAERNDRSWTELYPNAAVAWNSLYLVQRELGHHSDAIESGKRALALVPTNQGLYVNLAYSQEHAGDIQGAKATLDTAIAKKLDGDELRAIYMDVAIMLDDQKLIDEQHAWGVAHPQSPYLHLAETEYALGQGRMKDAQIVLGQVTSTLREQGMGDLADLIDRVEGLNFIEGGDRERGARLFKASKPDFEGGIDVIGLAMTGEADQALAALKTMKTKYPDGTLWNLLYEPRVMAVVAMANHKPREAAEWMEKSRPVDGRDLDMARVRGDAYLAAGDAKTAEKEYRSVISRRCISPKLGDYPRSWLGLGRALAAQGRPADALEAYQHFLMIWDHADPENATLMAAKKEFTELKKTH